jgi:ribosomal protein S5
MQQGKADWSFNYGRRKRTQVQEIHAGRICNQEEKMFDERVVYVNRVARVVKGGRRFRFQALVVLGDHKGRVGVGVSKGADVSAAVTKATEVAKKHLLQSQCTTILLTHDVEGKVGGSKILILPAAPGTGLLPVELYVQFWKLPELKTHSVNHLVLLTE